MSTADRLGYRRRNSAGCSEEVITKRYTILPISDPEEGGYTATVPTLLGCVTEGDTLEETLENVKDAIRLYLEDVEASGESIPGRIDIPSACHG